MGRKKGSKNKLAGDKLKDVTKAIGIKPCKGCNERAESVNNLHLKFKKLYSKGQPLTDEELTQWEEFKNRDNKNKVEPIHQELIVNTLRNNLYMSVKPCVSCGASKWNSWIDMIDNYIESCK